MLRTPREITPRDRRCTCKQCPTCVDPLTAAWIADSEAAANETSGVDLAAGRDWVAVNPTVPKHAAPPRHHQPAAADINRQSGAAIAAFDAYMAALRRQVDGKPDA